MFERYSFEVLRWFKMMFELVFKGLDHVFSQTLWENKNIRRLVTYVSYVFSCAYVCLTSL